MATEAETTVTAGNAANTQVETKADQVVPAATENQQNVNVTGRSVFSVETTAAGVVVRTAFLTEENRLLDMPAVFPNMMYAVNVIDDLKQQVIQHFSQAAQVGAQVIAQQQQQQQQQQQEKEQKKATAGTDSLQPSSPVNSKNVV
jgi:hypothetical protein